MPSEIDLQMFKKTGHVLTLAQLIRYVMLVSRFAYNYSIGVASIFSSKVGQLFKVVLNIQTNLLN